MPTALTSLTYDPEQFGSVQAEASAEGVPQRSHHGIQKDGAQVVKEEASWHEVARVSDDGGQQEEEEEGGLQLVQLLLIGDEDNAAEDQAEENQHTTLWDDGGEPLREVEHCKKTDVNGVCR